MHMRLCIDGAFYACAACMYANNTLLGVCHICIRLYIGSDQGKLSQAIFRTFPRWLPHFGGPSPSRPRFVRLSGWCGVHTTSVCHSWVTYKHTLMYIYTCTHTHIYICTYMHTFIYHYTYSHIYIYAYAHYYPCSHIYIYTYTHIHICIAHIVNQCTYRYTHHYAYSAYAYTLANALHAHI